MSRWAAARVVEADLLALRAAAERAGTALARLFSTADHVEAAIFDARRRRGTGGPGRRTRRLLWSALCSLALGLAFLML